MQKMYIPPGGFGGQLGQTMAGVMSLSSRGSSNSRNGPSARRRSKKRAAPKRARRTRRAGKRGNRFTKGSAAAKRYMAKLRRMRKR